MSKASRRKGHDYERDVARMMRDIYPEARRGYQARDGAEAPDVDETPFWVECKRGKRVAIGAAMRQAEAATDGRAPIVVSKEDRQTALATMRLEDLMRLLLAARVAGERQ